MLQFLDLSLSLQTNHLCWSFSPRSKKGLLHYTSSHSKVVKRGIALSCLTSALKKSCLHTIKSSFNAQIERLTASGFPTQVLTEVVGTLIKKVKGCEKAARKVDKKRVVVVPYIHRISHNLKQVANRYGVPLVMSAPQKMGQICSKVRAKVENITKHRCHTKHVRPYVPCSTRVVYSIPLSCGRSYVGQTGRCINDRLREHNLSLNSTVGGHLPLHCQACKCTPSLQKTSIIGRFQEKHTREIFEAFSILRLGERCVSQPSVALTDKEIAFLQSFECG